MRETIGLDEFMEIAEKGEEITQTIKSGHHITLMVHDPKPEDLRKIAGLQKEVFGTIDIETGTPNDAGIVMSMQDIDKECLIACIPQINDDNVNSLYCRLEDDCNLLNVVRERCGMSVKKAEESQ